MPNDPFVQYVLDQLRDLDGIRARAMFGGYGIYYQSTMVALIADGTLYLKVDETTRPDYEAEDCRPFIYHRHGKPIQMSYWEAPAQALDNAAQLREWTRKAHAAALRSGRRNAKKTGRRGPKRPA